MSELSKNANRCRQHYLAVFTDQQQFASNSQALDEALHHFLNQRPVGKDISWLDRATGLAAAPFWLDADTVKDSKLASLAISRILRHEGAISIELLEHLSHAVPDTLRWAIRYSKLFTRSGSELWRLLRDRVQGEEWRIFIGVCDRLLEQLQPFDQLIQRVQKQLAQQNNLTAVVNNLRRIGARRSGQMSETRRIELRLADQLRQRGFAVEVGYQPERTEQEDPGEVDLICYRDGLALLLEVKSGYIRSNKHEVWLHRTNTLRRAAWQLRRKRSAVVAALTRDEPLREKLGCSDLNVGSHLHAWIVDTSIELDHEWVDGFLVVSLESLQVILRDERQLLLQADQVPREASDTMFPDGFSAARFVEVVETGEVWKRLD